MSLQPDTADLFGDADDDDRDEHDRSDDHSHQLDEGITERLHRHSDHRPDMAKRSTDDYTEQNLDLEHFHGDWNRARSRRLHHGPDTPSHHVESGTRRFQSP